MNPHESARGIETRVEHSRGGGITRRQFLKMTGTVGAALALPSVTAACGGGAETGDQQAAGTAPAPGEKIGGSLTATYMSAGTYDVAAKDLVPAFEDKFGTNVTIAAFPWVTLLRNNTNDIITGAGAYDVLSGVGAEVWQHLVPIEDYIERDNYDPPFVSGLLDKVPRADGVLRGLPYGPDAYGLAVRTDLFEEAGIDVPDEAWTWDDFDAALRELDARYKDQGIAAFVLAGGAVDQLAPFFWGRYDGYHFNSEGVMQHDPSLAVEGLERLKRHLGYGPDNVLGLSIDGANAVFLQGNACMLEAWPSFTRAALVDPQQSKVIDKWAFVPYPTPGFGYLSLWDLSISEFSENQEAGWQWLKFYINQENDKQFFQKYGIGPAMVTTYEDLSDEYPNDFPATKTNLARAKKPVVTNEAELFLGQTVSEVVNDLISPKDGIAKVNKKWATMQPNRPEFEMAERQELVQS